MPTISPGCICTCRQTSTILYTVEGRAPDGVRWQLRSFRVSHQGNTLPMRREVGEGDIVVIRDPPSFSPGEMVEHDGVSYEVTSDNGDSVTLVVPQTSRPLRHGSALCIEAGHRVIVDKSDLVLAGLLGRAEEKE
jgi:hypothetical protein